MKQYKVYLDVCCLNRPFDSWQQQRSRFCHKLMWVNTCTSSTSLILRVLPMHQDFTLPPWHWINEGVDYKQSQAIFGMNSHSVILAICDTVETRQDFP